MSENQFENEFSDNGFWDKVKKYARSAGESVLEPALKLYYSAQDPETPVWAKTTIYGALGYFISPIDAIPDITPIVGYSDDLGVLAAAAAAVAVHVTKKHKDKAKETLKQWFG
ncbi:YkvA family protein [Vibrio porteresiae]|uniref:YkvA family protein n=1 Tax=Vibrio porteresiae DSM 19223 TaxID=1123496 RepID=A0ABZ0QHL1_9VIBR|nr:YkvA family protein [Vibrio porteresiae]WPC75925.1 YkvA family protein [Vibrio porteresiae DSM 19223]